MEKKVRGIITGTYHYNGNVVFRLNQKTKVAVPLRYLDKNIYDYLGLVFEGKGIPVKYYGGKFKTFVKVTDKDFIIEEPKTTVDVNERIETILKAAGFQSFYEYLKKDSKRRKVPFLKLFTLNPFIFVEKGKIDFLTALTFFYLIHGKLNHFPLIGVPAALSWKFWLSYLEEKKCILYIEDIIPELETNLLLSFPPIDQIIDYCSSNKKLQIIFDENQNKHVYCDWKFLAIMESLHSKLQSLFPEQYRSDALIDPSPSDVLSFLSYHKALVITGGPGTGKSTFLLNLQKICQEKNIPILLTGTTGNAASRIKSITTAKAFDVFDNSKGRSCFLDYDIIAIDEASMLDSITLHSVLKKLQPHQKIIFVGDPDQLPPVQGENIFQKIIEYAEKTGQIAKLTRTHRFSENKQNILYLFPGTSTLLYAVSYIILKSLKNQKELPMIITPYHHHTTLGTKKINYLVKSLKSSFHSLSFPSLIKMVNFLIKTELPPFSFDIGDLVMATRNIYLSRKEIAVANKERGIIQEIYEESRECMVFFPGRELYLRVSLKDIAPAYAVEFFTAQGAESETTVLILPSSFLQKLSSNEQNQKALYMALTRARKFNFILTTTDSNISFIKNLIPIHKEKMVSWKILNQKLQTFFQTSCQTS